MTVERLPMVYGNLTPALAKEIVEMPGKKDLRLVKRQKKKNNQEGKSKMSRTRKLDKED